MFLEKNKKNLRSLFSVFAVFGLAITALWWGANVSTINAQTQADDNSTAAAPDGGSMSTLFDFTGNGRTDFTTLRFNTGGPINWRVLGNPASAVPNTSFIRRFDYGFSTDSVVANDYVGDRKAELAVWRDFGATTPGTAGIYYLAQFPTGIAGITIDRTVRWGDAATDTPGAEGDYDGDGKIDYTVVRGRARGAGDNVLDWYIMSSSTGAMRRITFGSLSNVTGPAIFRGADFTGDGRDELIFVTRNSAGTIVNYFIGDAVTGAGVITRSFGNFNTDFNVSPDDYTGDGRADFIAVRQTQGASAVWYIQNSVTGVTTGTRFGIADPAFDNPDLPVRGDYDGDRRHDIAVWRPSNQTFYYLSSIFGNVQSQRFGEDGDFPIGSFGLY